MKANSERHRRTKKSLEAHLSFIYESVEKGANRFVQARVIGQEDILLLFNIILLICYRHEQLGGGDKFSAAGPGLYSTSL